MKSLESDSLSLEEIKTSFPGARLAVSAHAWGEREWVTTVTSIGSAKGRNFAVS